MSQEDVAPPPKRPWLPGRWAVPMLLLAIAAAVFLWMGLKEALASATKTRCITNERRISSAILLYCQDHDGRLPPPEYETAPGKWRHWFGLLQSYLPPDEDLVCPQIDTSGAREREHGYPFGTSYALNARFFGTFSPGPFPLENLELPAQTAMLVESQSFRDPAAEGRSQTWILTLYHDIMGRANAYPSVHENRMNVAAADGHVATVKPAHYEQNGHDRLLGRLGGSIYNWNGGHPNGDTSGAPRE